MLALCASLTALQFRWAGEVARVETARLTANLGAQLQQVGTTFDAELAAACTQLAPTSAEASATGAARGAVAVGERSERLA